MILVCPTDLYLGIAVVLKIYIHLCSICLSVYESLFVCLSVELCAREWTFLRRPGEDFGSAGVGVRARTTWCGCWEPNSPPLQEQPKLFIFELFLR